MKNKIKLFTILSVISGWGNSAKAQNVSIPDANFKAALISSLTINTNADGEIQLSEAASYTGAINVNSLSISDLTGIQAFTSLKGLQCSANQLTVLNVSSNPALTYIYCNNNQITSLVLSGAVSLGYLYCAYNMLTSLNVSSNTVLATLYCWSNQLTSLNVSGATALDQLYCHNNQLTSLNLSNNTALSALWSNNNPLTGLDLSANPNLIWLTSVNNQLTNLNVKNGNNGNLTQFNVTTNPGLTCIEVDNVTYMNVNWSGGKDILANFNTNCAITGIDYPANRNRETVIYPNPSAGIFTISLPDNQPEARISIKDVLGKCVMIKKCGREQKIDLSLQPKGIYFLEIEGGNKNIVKKIVVE